MTSKKTSLNRVFDLTWSDIAEWESCLKALGEQHFRKRRLIEILDGLAKNRS